MCVVELGNQRRWYWNWKEHMMLPSMRCGMRTTYNWYYWMLSPLLNLPWCQGDWRHHEETQHGLHLADECAHQPKAYGQSNHSEGQWWNPLGWEPAHMGGAGTRETSRTPWSSWLGGLQSAQLLPWNPRPHRHGGPAPYTCKHIFSERVS